jgi:hypothetical protein
MNKELARKALIKTMQDIDFKKIHKAMVVLDWTYLANEESPTVQELKDTCFELMDAAFEFEMLVYDDYKECGCCSGGFEITFHEESNQTACTIAFILESNDDIANEGEE